jgi:hypothetical protein
VLTRSAGSSRRRGQTLAGSGNEGLAESSPPLLTPGEVTRLRREELLVLAGNRQPARLVQRRWYADWRLRRLGRRRLPGGWQVPSGGPRRAAPLMAPRSLDEAGAADQAWWQAEVGRAEAATEQRVSVAGERPLAPGGLPAEGLLAAVASGALPVSGQPLAVATSPGSEQGTGRATASMRSRGPRGQVLVVAQSPVLAAGSGASDPGLVREDPQPARAGAPGLGEVHGHDRRTSRRRSWPMGSSPTELAGGGDARRRRAE